MNWISDPAISDRQSSVQSSHRSHGCRIYRSTIQCHALGTFTDDCQSASRLPHGEYPDHYLRSTSVEKKIEYSTRHYALVHYIVESENTNDIGKQVRPFLSSLKSPQLTGGLRTEYRTAALYWLAHYCLQSKNEYLRPHLGRKTIAAIGT